MTEALKNEIETYVENWYYDDVSKVYAFEMGKFLFGFIKYLDSLNMSERTLKNHKDNLYAIGMLELNYGVYVEEPFKMKNLEGGVSHEYEYMRKVSDSPTSVNRYRSTWNYIDKYIKTEAYLDFGID